MDNQDPNQLNLNFAALNLQQGNPGMEQAFLDARVPPEVTLGHLHRYAWSKDDHFRRTIAFMDPEFSVADQITMLWNCYRESDMCSTDFPGHAFLFEN